jgi:AraC-like DNA-binding protein
MSRAVSEYDRNQTTATQIAADNSSNYASHVRLLERKLPFSAIENAVLLLWRIYHVKKTTQRTLSPLPVHSLMPDSNPLLVLPLDHTNPYDFKREHRHTYYEVMLIERGGGNQLIDFRDYTAKNFSCYIIFPQQVHLMNRKKSTGILVQYTDECVASSELISALKQLSMKENAAIVFEDNRKAFRELSDLIELLKTYTHHGETGNRLALTHLLQAFISLTLVHAGKHETVALAPDKKLLFDFYGLLEQHYTENRGVQFFIQQLATTEKKLSASTRKHSGMSPLQVIHNRLLLEAKRMLAFEDTSHKEIAFHLGFDSPASFSAFIKTKTGLSPSELVSQLAEIHK